MTAAAFTRANIGPYMPFPKNDIPRVTAAISADYAVYLKAPINGAHKAHINRIVQLYAGVKKSGMKSVATPSTTAAVTPVPPVTLTLQAALDALEAKAAADYRANDREGYLHTTTTLRQGMRFINGCLRQGIAVI